MATFLVTSKLKLAGKPGVFLVGDIKSGTIRVGMEARIRVDGGVCTAVPVVGVEFVDHPGGASHVALHVSTENPDDNAVIDALTGDGDVIEVVEQQGASGTT